MNLAIEARARNLQVVVETLDRSVKAAEMSLEILKGYSYEFTTMNNAMSAWMEAHGQTNLR